MATAMRKGTVITEDQVISELIKIGLSLEVANDLSSRYYHNELTYKDLELVKMELQGNINLVKSELENKIDLTREELKGDIHRLEDRIDSVKTELENRIDLVKGDIKELRTEFRGKFTLLHWMIGFNSLLTLAVLASVLGFVFNK